MSRYSKFKVSDVVAKQGIDLVYPGQCKLRVTYMGSANKAYQRFMEEQVKLRSVQNRHQIRDNDADMVMLREAVARHVVLEWAVPHPEFPDKWIVGTDVSDVPNVQATGDDSPSTYKVTPDSIANRIAAFTEGPELLTDVMAQAGDYTRFREEELEAEAKN